MNEILCDLRVHVGDTLADVEEWLIRAALRRTHGDKQAAAKLLGVSLRTVYNKLKLYDGEKKMSSLE